MFEAYALLQAQNQLKLTDEQYADFIVRLRGLQKRAAGISRAGGGSFRISAALTNPQNANADEARFAPTLDALAREDATAAGRRHQGARAGRRGARRAPARPLPPSRRAARTLWKLDLLSRVRRTRAGPATRRSAAPKSSSAFRSHRWRTAGVTLTDQRPVTLGWRNEHDRPFTHHSGTVSTGMGHHGCRLDARGRRDTRRGCRRALHQGRVGRVPAQAHDSSCRAAPPPPPPGSERAKQTPILENELNSYLRYELREQVPAGVTEPTITIVGDGRVPGPPSSISTPSSSRASRPRGSIRCAC